MELHRRKQRKKMSLSYKSFKLPSVSFCLIHPFWSERCLGPLREWSTINYLIKNPEQANPTGRVPDPPFQAHHKEARAWLPSPPGSARLNHVWLLILEFRRSAMSAHSTFPLHVKHGTLLAFPSYGHKACLFRPQSFLISHSYLNMNPCPILIHIISIS